MQWDIPNCSLTWLKRHSGAGSLRILQNYTTKGIAASMQFYGIPPAKIDAYLKETLVQV